MDCGLLLCGIAGDLEITMICIKFTDGRIHDLWDLIHGQYPALSITSVTCLDLHDIQIESIQNWLGLLCS